MNIISEMLNWYRGEAFESLLTGIVGVLIIGISIMCWLLGKTPNVQALIIPLLTVGLILSGAGLSGFISNNKNVEQIKGLNMDDSSQIIIKEKNRVESFQKLYTYTKIGATISFFIAMGLFFLTTNRHLQAIGITLIIIGLSGIVIDFFSKERADNYYQKILILKNE